MNRKNLSAGVPVGSRSQTEASDSAARDQFKKLDQVPEVADIRERLSWLLKALRHAQAKENELVFEAIGRDLGVVG